MGFLWDEELDNLDEHMNRVANSDDDKEQFYLLVPPIETTGRGGYEVFVGKPGALEAMKRKAAEEATAAFD